MLNPIMVAEYVIYLEQNYCLNEWQNCKEIVWESVYAQVGLPS